MTFEVKSGESVGIVGRTGSGKSSLIVALFRLAEPYQGAVMLDGHNLLELGLQVVTEPFMDHMQRPGQIPCVRVLEVEECHDCRGHESSAIAYSGVLKQSPKGYQTIVHEAVVAQIAQLSHSSAGSSSWP